MNIKTTVLGIDQRQGEYWLFKDDLTRIYIKSKGTEQELKDALEEGGDQDGQDVNQIAEKVADGDQDEEMKDENEQNKNELSQNKKDKYLWFFIDEDEDLRLCSSLSMPREFTKRSSLKT